MARKILAPVDLGDVDSLKSVIRTGERLAELDGAELHVLTVVPSYSMPIVGSYFPSDFEEKTTEAIQTALARAIEDCASDPSAISGHVAHGTIYDQIIRAADRLGCDLIVMKSHRPELRDYLLGPNAARVVRHARQSVYVVRDQT